MTERETSGGRPSIRGDRTWAPEDAEVPASGGRLGRHGRPDPADDPGYDERAADDRYPANAPPGRAYDDRAHDDRADDDWEDDEWDDRRGGEYEELRTGSSRGRRVLTVLVVVFALVVVAASAAGLWVQRQLDPPGEPGPETAIVIPTGSSTGSIAELLEAEGVIAHAQVFRYYVRYRADNAAFQAGEYVLRANSAAWDVVEVLGAGPIPPDTRRFTIPEGLTVDEMAARLAEEVPGFDPARIAEVLAAGQVRPQGLPAEATSLEGYLFPDTYEIPGEADEAAALGLMAAQFDTVAAETNLVAAAEAIGRTPYEIITIASLIQEEAGILEDMPKIARVVYNRLDIGEPLGIDATSCYIVEERPCQLTTSDLESDSPYNTRINQGLPPTPIAAPGRDAILAALQPAEGPWIFYVLDPDASRTPPGGHFFTESASEFENVKDDCEQAGLGCG